MKVTMLGNSRVNGRIISRRILSPMRDWPGWRTATAKRLRNWLPTFRSIIVSTGALSARVAELSLSMEAAMRPEAWNISSTMRALRRLRL